tara:strand:+ start:148 stop:432 length:285 start_codon:yes stop_codon:yes gene_type:complete
MAGLVIQVRASDEHYTSVPYYDIWNHWYDDTGRYDRGYATLEYPKLGDITNFTAVKLMYDGWLDTAWGPYVKVEKMSDYEIAGWVSILDVDLDW